MLKIRGISIVENFLMGANRFGQSLTFKLSGPQRQDARPMPVKMYLLPQTQAWRPAVGAPLEGGVRLPSLCWAGGMKLPLPCLGANS